MKRQLFSPSKVRILAAVFGLVCLLAVAAQEKKPVKDTLTFSAVRVESILGKGKEKTVLTGKAKVLSGNLDIRADKIEITGENYAFVSCAGNVEVRDPVKGFTIKANKLTYDRPADISRTEGATTLEDSENGIVLKAEWIEFDQKKETILAQISVHILKEDFAARSEYALFNRKDNTLVMTGTPTVYSGGATVSATTISGGTSTDNLNLDGEVTGSILTTKPAETTDPAAATKGP